MRTYPLRPNLVLVLACLLAILFFLLDATVAQSYLWGSYLLPILVAFLWGRRRDIYIVTALASALEVAAYWFDPAGLRDLAVNHLLPLVVLWAAALLLVQRRQLLEQMAQSQQDLDAQVATRTAALQASEEQLAKIFRANPGGIAITRQSDGCFLEANEAYLAMVGCTREQLIGHTSRELGILAAEQRDRIRAAVLENGAVRGMDVQIHHARGQTVDAIYSVEQLMLGGESCFLILAVDMTERAQLEAHAKRLAALVEASLDAVMSADLDGTIVSLNRSAEDLYGTPAAATVGRNMVSLTPPEYVAPLQAMVDRVSCGEAVALDDVAWRLPDGSSRTLSISLSPIHDRTEQVIGFASIARDVTARRQMEREVARLAAIVQSSTDAIISADPDGTLHSMNPAAEQLFGITAGEAVGRHISLINPDLPESERAAMFARLVAGETFTLPDFTWTTPTGCAVDLSVTALPVVDNGGETIGLASIARNITARKTAERERVFLSALVTSSPDAIVGCTVDGTILSWNHGAEQLFGYTAEEAIGHNLTMLSAPGGLAQMQADMTTVAQGQPIEDVEPQRMAKDGRVFDCRISLFPVRDNAGEIVGVASFTHDISERKAAERALRDSEARFAKLFGSSPVGITLSRLADGRYLEVNDAFLAIVGYSSAELVGHTSLELGVISPEDRLRLVAELQEQGRVHGVDLVLGAKDGEQRHTLYAIEPLNIGGEPCVLSSIVDITERKRLEQTVTRLAAIVESSSDAIASTDLQGRVVSWNRSAEQLYGYSASQAIGRPINELLPPSPSTDEAAIVAMVRSGSTVPVADRTMTRADGTRIDLSIILSPVKDKQGAVVGASSIVRDITARKRLEAELQQSEARFRAMFADHAAVMLLIDPATGAIVDSNQAAALFYGYTTAELLTLKIWDISMLPRAEIQTQMQRARSREWNTFIFPHRLADGTIREVEVHSSPINVGSSTLLFSIIHDVTARREAEEALRNSEARYRLLVDNAEDVIWTIDLEGRFTFVNRAVECQLGYRPEEVIGQRFDRWLTPATAGAAMDLFAAAAMQVRAGQHPEIPQFEGEQVRKDGTQIFTQTIGVPLLDGAGRPSGFQGITRDVTERKQIEAALRESLTKYSVLFDIAPIGISLTDATGQLIEGNREAEQILGISQADQRRRTYDGPEWAIVRPDGTPMLASEYASVRALNEQTRVDNVEMGIIRTDGETRWIVVNAAPIPLPGFGVAITYADITSRKQMEEALAESERKYRDLYDHSPDMYFVGVPTQGLILDCNQTLARTLGYTTEEMIGGPSNVLFTPASYVELQAARAELLAAGGHDNYEVQLRRRDGTLLDTLMSVTVEYDPAGGPTRARVTLHDITERKRLEEALRDSEAQLRAIIENTEDTIWSVDSTYCLLAANSVFMRGVERQIGRMLAPGECVFDAPFPASERAFWQPLYDRALAGESLMVEMPAVVPPGGTLACFVYPIYAADGTIAGATGRNTDITALKEAEALLQSAYQRVRLAADAADIGIWNWNFADNSLEWDDRMCVLYGLPEEQRRAGITYDIWRARIHPDDLALAEPGQGELSQLGSQWSGSYRIVRPDGAVRYVQVSAVMEYDRDGSPQRMIGINRDITDQKLYEQLLQDTNAVLEERVAARTADLQTAFTELQRAGKLKDEFMAMISHELRTPLTGVLSMSEMLEEQISGPLNARQLYYVKGIITSGERLLAVINGILSYTHLLSGKVKLDPEPCDLAYLLDTCAASQQHKAAEKHQSIAVQVTPPDLAIMSDSNALAEVLKRLLDNAIKFTPEGGRIGLEAHPGIVPATVDLVVWDTGIGIAPDQQEHVFHAFIQADARLSRSHEGIGLGLAYADEMVRLLGGTVSVESTLGEGSRFTVTLPAQR